MKIRPKLLQLKQKNQHLVLTVIYNKYLAVRVKSLFFCSVDVNLKLFDFEARDIFRGIAGFFILSS
jgi:hypothetical protein